MALVGDIMSIQEKLAALCENPPLSWSPWNLKRAIIETLTFGDVLVLVWKGLRDGHSWGVRLCIPISEFEDYHEMSPERIVTLYYRSNTL